MTKETLARRRPSDDRPLEFDPGRTPTPMSVDDGRATRAAGRSVPLGVPTRYRELDDRSRRFRARLFGVSAALSGLGYLVLLPAALNRGAPLLSGAYFLAEASLLALFVLVVVDLWTLRFKPATGRAPLTSRSLDVLIPVEHEPLPVLERALTSAACLEWNGDLRVHVLDASGRLAVEMRARELGFDYHAPPRDGERAGRAARLNHGLAHSTGALIFVLDADHVVRSEALTYMAGYLDFARVGFVQSRSALEGPDGDPFEAGPSAILDTLQLGFDRAHSVVSCGSTALYVREALEDVGGFAEWNTAEDLSTSLELHSRGWKSLYFPYPMSHGIAPANVVELYRRRVAKAADALRIFLWDNPLLRSGLSWRARLDHLVIGLGYLWAALFLPVFLLIPVVALVTGTPLFVAHEMEVVLARLAYFGAFALAGSALFVGRGILQHARFLSGLFPVYLGGLIEALLQPPGPLEHRPVRPPRRPIHATLWLALVPQMALVAANLTLPAYALLAHTASTWVVATNVMASAAVLWALWPLLFQGLRQCGEAADAVRPGRLTVRARPMGGAR